MVITARDLGNPPLSAKNNAIVKITVVKNNFKPQFTNLPKTVTLSSTDSVGHVVYNVIANDRDTEVSFPKKKMENISHGLLLFFHCSRRLFY